MVDGAEPEVQRTAKEVRALPATMLPPRRLLLPPLTCFRTLACLLVCLPACVCIGINSSAYRAGVSREPLSQPTFTGETWYACRCCSDGSTWQARGEADAGGAHAAAVAASGEALLVDGPDGAGCADHHRAVHHPRLPLLRAAVRARGCASASASNARAVLLAWPLTRRVVAAQDKVLKTLWAGGWSASLRPSPPTARWWLACSLPSCPCSLWHVPRCPVHDLTAAVVSADTIAAPRRPLPTPSSSHCSRC